MRHDVNIAVVALDDEGREKVRFQFSAEDVSMEFAVLMLRQYADHLERAATPTKQVLVMDGSVKKEVLAKIKKEPPSGEVVQIDGGTRRYNGRTCSRCGSNGHDLRTCPQAEAANAAE